MELGIAIPTPPGTAEWQATKQFVANVVRRLPIGRHDEAIQVGVLTYRGQLTALRVKSITSVSP